MNVVLAGWRGFSEVPFILRLAVMLVIAAGIFWLAGCAGAETAETAALPVPADYERPRPGEDAGAHLRVGVILGPYSDMFDRAIKPFLADRGYTVELVQYNDFTLPNEALQSGQIDLNMFQPYMELISYKAEHDADLSAIAEVPTVAMGVFSENIGSLREIRDGFTVSVPEDSANFARALAVLESAGIIMLDPDADKSEVSRADIIFNPHNIEFFPHEAHTLPQTLEEYDMSVINGNFAISGGLNLADALFTERLDAHSFIVVAVRTEDLCSLFAEDIISIVRSDGFRAIIEDPAGGFAGFRRPPGFYVD